MLSAEYNDDLGSVLAESDGYSVSEMVLTPPKVTWLWRHMCEHPTLFSDYTRGDLEHMIARLQMPYSYWAEVYHGDVLVGVIYLEGLHRAHDCCMSVMFFDRALKAKAPLLQSFLQHIFQEFGLHRVTVRLPHIYRAVIRFLRGTGFVPEGRRREVYPIGNRWVDEVVLGLTVKELPHA